MSPNTTTREKHDSTNAPVLYVAFELGKNKWKLGFTTGFGQKPREKNILARDRGAVLREVTRTKKKFALPEDCTVKSCYEAGRDGFWLDRFLKAEGIENIVVDSASIEVNRKKKRAKTDRLVRSRRGGHPRAVRARPRRRNAGHLDGPGRHRRGGDHRHRRPRDEHRRARPRRDRRPLEPSTRRPRSATRRSWSTSKKRRPRTRRIRRRPFIRSSWTIPCTRRSCSTLT